MVTVLVSVCNVIKKLGINAFNIQNKCVRVHVCMPERYSCYCTSADIPVVCNIYVIPFREQSVFKSDFFFLNYFVFELSLTLIPGFNKDWIFINN